MRNDRLSVQSMDFAVQIINLVKELKPKRESIISNQIGRSGTSIGANIREAQYAHGTADFIAKIQIALKGSNETGYQAKLYKIIKFCFAFFYAEKYLSASLLFIFRKQACLACLFGCKRPHNGTLSRPPFCEDCACGARASKPFGTFKRKRQFSARKLSFSFVLFSSHYSFLSIN